tara:strand:- start:166 stop:858 length:693 start_codon:yes stop_codon:yes gene_type:complete
MKKTIYDIFMPAGGRGKRLGAISNKTPKPLIKINNQEFIIKVIKSLLKIKFSYIYILTSYKDTKFFFIKDFFSKYFFKLNLIKDTKRIGTFNALYNVREHIKNDFIYSNSDEILDINIAKIIKIFEKYKLDILQLYFLDSKGINLDNKLIINKKKFYKNRKYVEGGLKIFNKNIFKKKFPLTKYFKIEDFIKNNKKKLNVKYFIIKDKPYSIDTWKRIQRTKKFLKKKNL